MSDLSTPASKRQNTPQDRLRAVLRNWVALRGRPALLFQSGMIQARTMLRVQQVLRGKSFPKLDVILESPGGSPDHAFRVATLIHDHAKEVVGVVPHYAKSACTLIALGMDELILGELGELGPLDTQRWVKSSRDEPKPQSSLEVVHAMRESQQAALNLWNLCARLLIETEGLNVAGAYELAATFVGKIADTHYSKIQLDQFGESVRSLDIGKKYAKCVLERYAGFSAYDAEKMATQLVEGYPSHNYALDLPELVDAIGLNARRPTQDEEALLDQAQLALDALPSSRGIGGELIELFEPAKAPVSTPQRGDEKAGVIETFPQEPGTPIVHDSDADGRSGQRKVQHEASTAQVPPNGGMR